MTHGYRCDVLRYEMNAYHMIMQCNYQAHPDYMKHQREITCEMRKILVDWLLDMTEYVNLPMDTLFVAINIIDRFSSKRTVKKQYYQLLGVVGLWIAIKMHEFCDKELIKELLVMTDNSFTLDEVSSLTKQRV